MKINYQALLLPLIISFLWIGSSVFGKNNSYLIPSPAEIIQVLPNSQYHLILKNMMFTFRRTTSGFLLACIIGIPIGLALGYFQKLNECVSPTLNFFRNIPVSALFSIFIFFFGIGEIGKIAAATWAAFFTLAISASAGVLSVKKLRIQAARLLKLSSWSIFQKIIFPEALPQIFTGLRISYALSFIIVIVSKMTVGTNYGLGKMINDSQLTYQTGLLYLSIFITGLLGYSVNQFFLYLEKKIIFWQGK